MSLASKYRREIQSWNWDAIIKEAHANPSETMDGDTVGMCYLGSLINPSGKYYLPFACSNVEPCPTCKGSGHTKKQYTCEGCNGLKFRTVEPMHLHENFANMIGKPLDRIRVGDTFTCNYCEGKGTKAHTCHTCNGVGSLEAYRDEVWQETLEAVANEHGGSVEAGEGDPCDTFFVIALETEEEEDSETETEDTANA